MIYPHYPAIIGNPIPGSIESRVYMAPPILGPRNILNANLNPLDVDSMIKLAEDKKTDAAILKDLSCHDDVRVRSAVADNPNIPYTSLLKLAQDQSHDIRYQLAENHNVPEQVISILAEDENPYVAVRAQWTLNRLRAPYIAFA